MIQYIYAGVGAAVSAAATYTFISLFVIPDVKEETRQVAEAEAQERTYDAINSVSDIAERARAMRRYCSSRGLRYDFGNGKCREQADSPGG